MSREAVKQAEVDIMDTTTQSVIRDRLIERRRRLEAMIAKPAVPEHANIRELLHAVDAALEQMEAGNYGLCVVCHDSVETERLMVDPLLRHCLDHLTPAQQRALEKDLDLSARIQQELLPRQPIPLAGWETSCHYEPLGAVSGDYYDLLPADDGQGFYFLLGDVAGKGVAASILMAHLHALFRSLVAFRLPLEEIVSRANRIFFEATGGSRYSTLVGGHADASGSVKIVNAGHCPPLWLHDGEAAGVPATGPPLGLFPGASFGVERFTLGRGESMLLYTDGLTEATGHSDDEYGLERLRQWAAGRQALSADALVEACRAEVEAHRAGLPRSDDLTLLAVRRRGE